MIKKYPQHFHDPIRIEIATSQIQHDLRKILPDLSEEDWRKVDGHVSGWFLGEDYELEPVHDFWNLFGSFSRDLKFKSLIFWITAENVLWSKEEVPVDQIVITWDFPGLEFMGKAPYLAKEVIEKLAAKEFSSKLAELKVDSKYRSERYPPRDEFPIILFQDKKGGVIDKYLGYYILEGNRRTVKAITHNNPKISAYVGRFSSDDEVWPKNYWIRTGILRDLIFLAINYEKENDEESFAIVRKFYQLLLRDFDVARIVTIDKAFKNFETDEKLLKELMTKDIQK
jgi:hypothetical protein